MFKAGETWETCQPVVGPRKYYGFGARVPRLSKPNELRYRGRQFHSKAPNLAQWQLLRKEWGRGKKVETGRIDAPESSQSVAAMTSCNISAGQGRERT